MIDLIRNLYTKSRAAIRVEDTLSETFQPTKGVRQRCILPSILFNIYSEAVLREALQEWKRGEVIEDKKIKNMRFADDTTLYGKSETEINQLLKCTEESSNKYGLTINRKKTMVIVIDRADLLPPTTVLKNYQKIEEFIYLGSLVQTNGSASR